MSKAPLHDRIEHNLSLHRPKNDDIGMVMDTVRGWLKTTSHLVVELVPEGREQSLALTALEDACMQAIAGIARNQDAVPTVHPMIGVLPAPVATH